MNDSGELALGSIDYAIYEVEKIRIKCNQYVIDDCLYHLKRAKEALQDGLDNPFDWEKFFSWFKAFAGHVTKNDSGKLPATRGQSL
jgi:hypothetical protein